MEKLTELFQKLDEYKELLLNSNNIVYETIMECKIKDIQLQINQYMI